MNTAGWITMIASVGSVLALLIFCVVRLMALPPANIDTMHAPLDIDTGDTRDAD